MLSELQMKKVQKGVLDSEVLPDFPALYDNKCARLCASMWAVDDVTLTPRNVQQAEMQQKKSTQQNKTRDSTWFSWWLLP